MSPSKRPTAVVTAGYSGLGSELCKLLVGAGFDLVLVNRDAERSRAQMRELAAIAPAATVHSVTADLSDHEAIHAAAAQIAGLHAHIELLVHNAGVLLNSLQQSPQGNDLHFEVNTVAPFLLTELLRPQLAAAQGSAVLLVGSSAMRMARALDIPGLPAPKAFKRLAPYAQSKLAATTMFFALAPEYAKDRILLRVVDPGPARTAMSTSAGLPGWFRIFRRFFNAPDVAAKRIYAAAADPALSDQSSVYIQGGNISTPPAPVTDSATQQKVIGLLRRTTGQAQAMGARQ
jgi:NAD(P)-dependent dehydrogenase (short-subunit alcohol dehydrogenase family)